MECFDCVSVLMIYENQLIRSANFNVANRPMDHTKYCFSKIQPILSESIFVSTLNKSEAEFYDQQIFHDSLPINSEFMFHFKKKKHTKKSCTTIRKTLLIVSLSPFDFSSAHFNYFHLNRHFIKSQNKLQPKKKSNRISRSQFVNMSDGFCCIISIGPKLK